MHISLTSTLEDYVKQKVYSGMYNNASEVVREALRLLHKEDGFLEIKRQKLRLEVAVGAEQAARGEFVTQSISEIFEEVRLEKHDKV